MFLWCSVIRPQRIRAVLSESSLSAWKSYASLAFQDIYASEDSDQTTRMRRLIWIFAGCTCPKIRFLTLRIKWKTVPWKKSMSYSFSVLTIHSTFTDILISLSLWKQRKHKRTKIGDSVLLSHLYTAMQFARLYMPLAYVKWAVQIHVLSTL